MSPKNVEDLRVPREHTIRSQFEIRTISAFFVLPENSHPLAQASPRRHLPHSPLHVSSWAQPRPQLDRPTCPRIMTRAKTRVQVSWLRKTDKKLRPQKPQFAYSLILHPNLVLPFLICVQIV